MQNAHDYEPHEPLVMWRGKICILQVALFYRTQPFCGGTLLSSMWVLTAAHCLMHDISPKKYSVLAGTTTVIPDEKKRVGVRSLHLHPQFAMVNLVNDIGLVEVRLYLSIST